MTLALQINALAQEIGAVIKAIKITLGDNTALTTTDKTSLVNAVNEVNTKIGALINDLAGAGVTDKTWSADKILAYTAQLKSDIMGGITPAALDTIFELAAQLESGATQLNGILIALGNRVRVDAAQSFDPLLQQQGRDNIGAASQTDLTTLATNVGDTTTDFVAAFNAALA